MLLAKLTRAIDASLEVVDARRSGESSYVTANARAAYRLGRMRLTLDLMNLTNASWLDASGQPTAGRAALFGVAWGVDERGTDRSSR